MAGAIHPPPVSERPTPGRWPVSRTCSVAGSAAGATAGVASRAAGAASAGGCRGVGLRVRGPAAGAGVPAVGGCGRDDVDDRAGRRDAPHHDREVPTK